MKCIGEIVKTSTSFRQADHVNSGLLIFDACCSRFRHGLQRHALRQNKIIASAVVVTGSEKQLPTIVQGDRSIAQRSVDRNPLGFIFAAQRPHA